LKTLGTDRTQYHVSRWIFPLLDLYGTSEEETTMSNMRMDTKYEFELLLDSHAVAKLMGVHPETVKRRVRCGNHSHRNFIVLQPSVCGGMRRNGLLIGRRLHERRHLSTVISQTRGRSERGRIEMYARNHCFQPLAWRSKDLR
jgi:hypothetical protein